MCQRCIHAMNLIGAAVEQARADAPTDIDAVLAQFKPGELPPQSIEDVKAAPPDNHHVCVALVTLAVHEGLRYFGNPIAFLEKVTDITLRVALGQEMTAAQEAFGGVPMSDGGQA